MGKTRKLFLFGVLFFCQGAHSLGASTVPHPVLFFVSDGFNTANGGAYEKMYQKTVLIADRLRRKMGTQTLVVPSGFSGDYFSCEEREQLYYRMPPLSAYSALEPARSATAEQYVQEIARWVRKYPHAVIVMIGHSHGAWLMMKLTLSLSQELPVVMLATLDPISLRYCDRTSFVHNAVSIIRHPRAFGGGSNCCPPGDLRGSFSQIRQRVRNHPGVRGQWLNFYQDQFPLLHSGPISEADRNIRCAYARGYTVGENAHSAIAADGRVWEQIEKSLRQILRY